MGQGFKQFLVGDGKSKVGNDSPVVAIFPLTSFVTQFIKLLKVQTAEFTLWCQFTLLVEMELFSVGKLIDHNGKTASVITMAKR